MKKFAILSDSCCDLDRNMRLKYDVDYIPMRIIIENKTAGDTDIPADLDWPEISFKDFYGLMRAGTRIRTAQIKTEEYEAVFDKYLSKGMNVLYIACSSALSGSYKSSLPARDAMNAKYSKNKVVCIDSRNACMGLGLICITASELRSEGNDIDKTAEYIEAHKQEVNQYATVESLVYLKRAGRVSTTSAVFGGILQVKPIIISSADGQNVAIEKVKGRKNSLVRIADMFKENYADNPHQHIFIMHADSEEDAAKLKALIEERMPDKSIEVLTYGIGPIIGSTTGPGALAVYSYGKNVTV